MLLQQQYLSCAPFRHDANELSVLIHKTRISKYGIKINKCKSIMALELNIADTFAILYLWLFYVGELFKSVKLLKRL